MMMPPCEVSKEGRCESYVWTDSVVNRNVILSECFHLQIRI